MTFIDLFAGVGGFRRGMELAGHMCLGFCEWDKAATASYISMHCITDEQREYLSTLDMRTRQNEILKEEYLNGEWYADDIRTVDAGSVPRADCWCFGFPCQDISIAGKQLGFGGHRSSLFFAVTKIIRELEEEERPKYLFIENVKNLLSVNGGVDFLRLLVELDEIGYDAEWSVLNSKDFGVPQNRERVFVIGHLRGRCTTEVFPLPEADRADRIHQVGQDACFTVRNGTKRGYAEADVGDSVNLAYPKSEARRARVGKEISNTLTASDSMGVVVKLGDGNKVYAVWSEKHHCYVTIRKLTPKEFFRLQGWTDDYFEKARFVSSDSQLYKQAGNGVTVNVIRAIAERMSVEENPCADERSES